MEKRYYGHKFLTLNQNFQNGVFECLKLTLTLAVDKNEMDMSTDTFMGRPSVYTTAPPTSSTRFAIAPEPNLPFLSCYNQSKSIKKNENMVPKIQILG